MQIDNRIPEVARQQIEHIAEVCERIKPLVVIGCITYNHEAFLRDALEGFVMQKTNFPFVAVVHDDASTDGTAAVLREYAERYPDIILPIYEKENQYSKHDGSLGLVTRTSKAATGAKYVALCEGDDYWTSPDKLQRQVDFLEANPEYSLVFHNAPIKQFDGSFDYNKFIVNETREYKPSEILVGWTIPTASMVYRREKIDNDPVRANPKFVYGDDVLVLTCAKYGHIYGFDENMSVYRRQRGSLTNSVDSIKWTEKCLNHTMELDENFAYLLEKQQCKYIVAKSIIYLIRRQRDKPLEILKYFIKGFAMVPIQFTEIVVKTWILRK